LNVWATSDLGSGADLSVTIELAAGDPVTMNMAWKSKKSRWEKSVKRFSRSYGSDPVAVTVSGVEGEVSTAVN
jgi:hypothetical protein